MGDFLISAFSLFLFPSPPPSVLPSLPHSLSLSLPLLVVFRLSQSRALWPKLPLFSTGVCGVTSFDLLYDCRAVGSANRVHDGEFALLQRGAVVRRARKGDLGLWA
jgi:hypothetical protein